MSEFLNTETPSPKGKVWEAEGRSCDQVATSSLGGPCRQLGGSHAEDLRKKLRAREEVLRIELADVRRALNFINNDESVQKVLEVISVANK